ncbi:uncharacterized protein LOC118739203 [Rhagoletis pomonella]|uniref:uncharacterized protein LOC118739203 n=1 Tax=Rhagoletis pomonella TaxID=28610 RepID=UPI0017844884|nr:uncharacterized protein LOC118739203 [Rhagoletis pomonella]
MHIKWLYETCALLIFSLIIPVHGDIREECNNKPSNAFIVSNTSCSHYIYCAGIDSYEGECPDGDYFNELLQTCDPSELVDCKLNTTASNPSVDTPAPALTTTTIISSPSPATINNSIISSINTTAGEIFLSTTPAMATSYPGNGNTSTMSPAIGAVAATTLASITNGDTAIIISNKCPALDNPRQMIFVPHSKSCSDYFICYHGERLAMHCSSMLHFNVNTGKCDYPEIVGCRTDFSNPREQCQLHTIDLYPHTTNCNYFYYCRNGYLLLQQCPFGYGWDIEKRACTAMLQAICYNRRNKRKL